MKTDILTDFIAKYNLPSGEVEVAKWKSTGSSLIVRFSTADESCFGYVETHNADLPSGEYFITDTSTLRSLLNVLGTDITVTTKELNNVPVSMHITDKKNKIAFALGDDRMAKRIRNANVEPDAADVMVSAPITPEFMTAFLKGKSALRDVSTFTVWSDGSTTELIIGYEQRSNSNRVTIAPDATIQKPLSHTSFLNQYLYDILNANKGSTGVLQVVQIDGAAPFIRVHYKTPEWQATYIINKQED